MPTDNARERLRRGLRVWIDAFSYALVVVCLVFVGTTVLAVATGGGFVRTKLFLFLTGWLLLSYTTIRLWPTEPGDTVEESTVAPEPDPTRFQTLVRTVSPIRPPPPNRRIPAHGKLFLAAVLVLFVSLLMETVFGIS